MDKNKEKVKIKRKGSSKLTPITLTIISLGVFVMVLSIGLTPELMGNSVSSDAYTIKYNANGGVGKIKDQVIKSGDTVQLRMNKFTKDGYTFAGWRAYRSDGMWDCYIDNNKSTTSWTVQSYCNKYGYSLYKDGVYIRNLVSGGMKVTLFAEWKKN